MKSSCRHLRFVFFLLLLVVCSCTYTRSLIQSDDDIKAELHNSFPKVVRAYKWSAFDELVPFMLPKITAENIGSLQKFYSIHKIKEVDVDNVEFEGSEVKKAYQTLVIKTFSPPTYIVDTHVDQLTWEYSPGHGGWMITRIDIGAAQDADETSSDSD